MTMTSPKRPSAGQISDDLSVLTNIDDAIELMHS